MLLDSGLTTQRHCVGEDSDAVAQQLVCGIKLQVALAGNRPIPVEIADQYFSTDGVRASFDRLSPAGTPCTQAIG